MAKLGFHIAAGMMQGLGAGIIENAKQKREAALRAMDIDARRQESAADRASREALTDKELGARTEQHKVEMGMRGKELEAGREERKLAREENQAWRDQTRQDTLDYRAEQLELEKRRVAAAEGKAEDSGNLSTDADGYMVRVVGGKARRVVDEVTGEPVKAQPRSGDALEGILSEVTGGEVKAKPASAAPEGMTPAPKAKLAPTVKPPKPAEYENAIWSESEGAWVVRLPNGKWAVIE